MHRSGNTPLDKECLQLAQHYGLPKIVITTLDGKRADKGKIYSGVSELGIPSVLAEVGRNGLLEESATRMHLDGLNNVLKHVGSIEGSATAQTDPMCYENWFEPRCCTKGVFYSHIRIGEEIEKGQTLGVVEDYFGNEIETVRSPDAGTVLVAVASPAVKPGTVVMIVGPQNAKPLSAVLEDMG